MEQAIRLYKAPGTRNYGIRIGMRTYTSYFQPAPQLGKPVIRGTRVTVELLLRKLSEGG